MSDKYIIDEEGEYVIDTETNDMWDATGGGDGIYMLVKKVNKLLEENKQLKKENKKLHSKIFEMRTNEALERTEISKQSYDGYKTEKEFLKELEKL